MGGKVQGVEGVGAIEAHRGFDTPALFAPADLLGIDLNMSS